MEHSAQLHDTRTPHTAGKTRNTILFLAANPIGAGRVDFDRECAEIERELRLADARDDFDFRSRWAVTADEMMRHLNELCPTVIHFSGHGFRPQPQYSPSSPRPGRDVSSGGSKSPGGIYLQDEHGNPQPIAPRALRMMIKAAAGSARVIVLNTCHSKEIANELCSTVECAIGMNGAIQDDAARAFAIGFYRAIGSRRSIANAVEQAVAILAAKQLPDARVPCCRTRKGVDPRQLVLAI